MERKGLLLLAACCFLVLGGAALAFGDVVGGATIDVNIDVNALAAITVSGSDVSFTVGDVAATAGALPHIDDTGNTPTYLQYTSIVPALGSRTIAVQADAAVPAGLKLNIRAGTPTGNGGVGTPVAGGVNIGSTYTPTTDLTILNGITSCATGTAVSQGAPVYYTLAIDEQGFKDLTTTAATQTLTVTFTLVGP